MRNISGVFMKSNISSTLEVQQSRPKRLKIGYQKICDCSPNHINCLTPKEWVKSQVGIWEFAYEKRDIRDKTIHPAVFPIGLPKKVIQLFTHEGELVLDPFAGIGTTLVAAADTNRNAVGFDIKKDYVDYTKKRLLQTRISKFTSDQPQQMAINADARDIPNYFEEETISLVVTSPPYADMLNRARKNKSMRGSSRENEQYGKNQQYSNDSRDLGILPSKIFAKEFAQIYKNILPSVKKRGHVVININDPWVDLVKYGKRDPLHSYIIEEMNNVGYELRNVLIWDKRNLVNGVGIFGWPSNYIKLGTTFEYILDFWRPPTL